MDFANCDFFFIFYNMWLCDSLPENQYDHSDICDLLFETQQTC